MTGTVSARIVVNGVAAVYLRIDDGAAAYHPHLNNVCVLDPDHRFQVGDAFRVERNGE